MNARLHAIAARVQDGIGLIDVGTDHGYLPVWLAKSGYRGTLYASDINEGPLMAAKRSALEADVHDRIHFLLCDGLSLCPPEKIDTIIIAGMGGDMIVKILDEAEWCMDARYRLILQPMTKAEVLRYWLIYNGFAIHSETIAEDGALLYQIITTGFGGKTELSDAELFVGKRSLCESELLYERQLARFSARVEKACRGMCSGKEGARFQLYQEIMRQLRDMRGTP